MIYIYHYLYNNNIIKYIIIKRVFMVLVEYNNQINIHTHIFYIYYSYIYLYFILFLNMNHIIIV